MAVEIHELLRETVEDIERYDVENHTGASASIRLRCKVMNPQKRFAGQEREALEGMRLVVELSDLAKKLDWNKILKILEMGAENNKNRR